MNVKQRQKRIKIDWIFMIRDLGLSIAFNDYKAAHNVLRVQKNLKRISDNRLARAFCIHLFKLIDLEFSSLYEKDNPIGLYNYFKKMDQLDLFRNVMFRIHHFYNIELSVL